jgi:hypothetical protein
MSPEQVKALRKVPRCVELEDLDGTWEHVVFRVEHVVMLRSEGEDFYTRREAEACRRWLAKHAASSKFATVSFQ